MIERNDILSIPYLKKSTFSGSCQGMRFLLKMEKGGERTVLIVSCWPEPFSYHATAEEEKKYAEFEFSEEGIRQAIDWLNQMWAEQEEKFCEAKENWDRA